MIHAFFNTTVSVILNVIKMSNHTNGSELAVNNSNCFDDWSDPLIAITQSSNQVSDGQAIQSQSQSQSSIEHYQTKITRTKQLIKAEQNTRDDNVNEYLKLASNADKIQLQRIKRVFEKKNQKFAQTIAHLQKKLDNYNKKLRELECRPSQAQQSHQSHHYKQTNRDKLKGITGGAITSIGGAIGGIKSGITAAVSHTSHNTHTTHTNDGTKTRELIVSKNRFQGSAENLNNANTNEFDITTACGVNVSNIDSESGDTPLVVKTANTGTIGNRFANTHSHSDSTRYTETDNESSENATSDRSANIACIGDASSAHDSHAIQSTTALIDLIQPIMNQLQERQTECRRLSDEVDSLRDHLHNECSVFHQSLVDERYRFERLEEQMNDLIELHQNEIENLKQCVADMVEKVQYQSEERLRDVHDMLERCQTRITRMEHQQHQHLQQLVNLDSLENSNARALVLKLINVVLTILQVILLLVATIANITAPFLRSRVRILFSIITLSLVMIIFQRWPDFGFHLICRQLSQNWRLFSHQWCFDRG